MDQAVGPKSGDSLGASSGAGDSALYQGRHVFLGDSVKDKNFDYAEFEALGSNPPSLDAAKALDEFSLLPGMALTQSGAHSAYT